jgi:hypothetical protein
LRRVLCSWIGYADLQALAQELDDEASRRIYEAIGRAKSRVDTPGPIRTLVGVEAFDEVHLLCDQPKWLGSLFARRISPKTTYSHRIIEVGGA